MAIEISREELERAGVVAGCPARSDAAPAVACPSGAAAAAEGSHRIERTLPIVGIVPTFKASDSSLELPERYVKAVIAAGGAPVVLPFAADVSIYETLLPNIDGFLLSGGQDIDPVRYGEDITFGKAEELAPGREEVEYLIISFARQYDVPVLGICRGMQMINVAFGGSLYQDLGEQAKCAGHWQTEDYSKPTHHVRIEQGTLLHRVLGMDDVHVNSMHHQGIRDVGSGLVASAFGEDGVVEAVEAPGLSFLVGVQWHPEFFAGEGGIMAPLLSRLVSEAASVRNRNQRCRACLSIMREECGGCFPNIRFAGVTHAVESAREGDTHATEAASENIDEGMREAAADQQARK